MTSLARGLAVIRAFTAREPNLTIAEVARISGLPRAAARRCLYTLQQLGYAATDGKTFALTPRILTLGYAFLTSAALPQAIQPFLERVREALHESSSAAVLDEDGIVYVARAPTRRIMSIGLDVGTRLPAYCSAMGRVCLANLPPAALDAYLRRIELKPLTERTIVERGALRRELEAIRAQGYAVIDQELEIGLVSIAVPLRNGAGTVIAAMNVSMQAARFVPADLEHRYLPVLREAADEARALSLR
jgi:IclR family pca regulon transcriptional regulator